MFLIDEPDIYLHSDLQRQLLGILRQLGPDILIATHSTEIISDAESEELVVINKAKKSAKRIRKPAEVAEILGSLGSTLNPTLTQLAKTRRALFVEGQDFEIIGRFARKLGEHSVANHRDFAVIPTDGFAPEKIRNLKAGIEAALGFEINAAAILDRDYRCGGECAAIMQNFKSICSPFIIHKCKEIENFLLVVAAIERAASRKHADRVKRGGDSSLNISDISNLLSEFCSERRFYVQSQLIDARKRFERVRGTRLHEATILEEELKIFNSCWSIESSRYEMIPGKEAIRKINYAPQEKNMGLTNFAIIDAMRQEDVHVDMKNLVAQLAGFSSRIIAE